MKFEVEDIKIKQKSARPEQKDQKQFPAVSVKTGHVVWQI